MAPLMLAAAHTARRSPWTWIAVLLLVTVASIPTSAQRQRAPLTKSEVQQLWERKAQVVFQNELKSRGLAFRPEEDWMARVATVTRIPPSEVPTIAAALGKLIEPAPELDAARPQIPELLEQVRKALQARDDALLSAFVHPELLATKAKLTGLFDATTYQRHVLGKVTTAPSRRVGVQFFQLTKGQVELFHYVTFGTLNAKLVVRDVFTGTEVASEFLRDEQTNAVDKLRTAFRGLFVENDDTELKNMCTPALYQHLLTLSKTDRASGSTVPPPRVFDALTLTPSVPLDQKSVRVVVRVSYPTRSGRSLEFDVDFERLSPDLRIVRLRDMNGGWVAFDPELENYLNRRYSLPPKGVPNPTPSEVIDFKPREELITLGVLAVESRDLAKINEIAQVMSDRFPNDGIGAGVRAGALHISGKYAEAVQEAERAVRQGGKAYFVVSHHRTELRANTRQFWPAVLAVSRDKVEYQPLSSVMGGAPTLEIPIAAIEKVQFDRSIWGPRPMFNLKFRIGKDSKQYNFGAFGIRCPGTDPLPGEANVKTTTENASGMCTPLFDGNNSRNATYPTTIPYDWRENVSVVMRTIEGAMNAAPKGAPTPAKR